MRFKVLFRYLFKKDRPRGDTYYGDKASGYLVKREKQEKWHTEQEVVENFLELLPNDLRVLDVPFGTGRFVPLYLKKNFKVYGIDASEDMLKTAESYLGLNYENLNVIVGDATCLPYEENYFDLVVSIRFLRSIISFGQAKKALEEIYRVTKQYAFIELGANKLGRTRWPRDHEPMITKISYDDIIGMLNYYGFTVESTGTIKEKDSSKQVIFFVKKVHRKLNR